MKKFMNFKENLEILKILLENSNFCLEFLNNNL